MPKETFDLDGNLFIATKRLKIIPLVKGEPSEFEKIMVFTLKDTEALKEFTEKMKKHLKEEENTIYGEDYKFEVEDI